MEEKNLTISIAHMYPSMLNLNGDCGNVIALKKRCDWHGINVEFSEINIGDAVGNHDLYFIAGGQDKQHQEVSIDLQSKKTELIARRDEGAVFLGVCGGYQLLGNYIQLENGEKIQGVSLLDAYTVLRKDRFIGNVTAQVDFLNPETLVGFENNNGVTYLQGDTKPLAKVVVGCGNNGDDGLEGARFKNVFGTYMHGALLPKNPHFADYLIELALEKRYGEKINLSQLDDKLEIETHNSLINRAH